jgi:putative membrane protein
MNLFSNGVVGLVALLHVYFLVLEMFFWTKPLGLKTFRRTAEQARESASLAANQGLYNGFLAAGLGWGLLQSDPTFAHAIKVYFLGCVLVAGIFGGFTASRKIFYVQAFPAAVGLVLQFLG